MNSIIANIIHSVKSNTSVPQLLARLLNIPTPRVGSAINAPAFIRHDNNPSFGIYNNIAIDFATGKFYDVIELTQLALNMSFIDALTYLHGQPIYAPRVKDTFSIAISESQRKFNSNLEKWHSNLLNNNAMLDYLHSRNIHDDTIDKFNLGFAPEMQRIIFPFWKNSRWVYYAGRDMQGNGPKYKKGRISEYDGKSLSEYECFENVPWGLQTINHRSNHRVEYKGVDGQSYSVDAKDPRDDTLCLTEGLVDALSLAQDEWQVLATAGGFIGKYFEREFIDLARSYRQVVLCFDNDTAGEGFQLAMAKKLFDAHVPFVCAHIPHIVNGLNVKDISDYYCAGGDLAELVKHATPGLIELAYNTQTLDELAQLFISAARWLPSYKLFELKEACYSLLDKETGFPKYSGKMINHLYGFATQAIPERDVAHLVDQKHKLLFDPAGVFYEYTKGVWQQLSDFEVQGYVGDALGMKASSGRMRSVTSYLKAEHASTDREALRQLNTKNVRVLLNGTIHLDTALTDIAAAFTPHSPDDMSSQLIPCNYDPNAQAPKWMKYIHDVSSGDPAKARLMQQMAGYILCPDNRYHKFFYLLGDGRNGKSVFMNVLEAVYGSENCASLSPSRLGTQFDPIALKDAIANFCYEAKVSLNGSEEALKAVVSGDPIMAAHKGVDAVKFSTRAKIFIAANKCFASDDVSLGFLSRIIFLKFDKQFLGSDANKNLYKELLEELPGIFNWCLAGYIDLVNSGGFQEIQEQADLMDELLEQMSPTGLFIREMFPLQAGRVLSDRDMYACYKQWADDGGFKRLNRTEFMKDLMLLIRQQKATIDVNVVKNDEGKRLFVFPGNPEVEDNRAEQSAVRGGNVAPVVIALGVGMAQGETGQAQSANEAPSTEANVAEPMPQTTEANAADAAAHDEEDAHNVGASNEASSPNPERDSAHNGSVSNEALTDDAGTQPGQVQRARKTASAITEAEIQSGMTTSYDTPLEIHSHYITGMLKPWDMTLGDWRALYSFYKCYPSRLRPDVDFYGECQKYVMQLKAKFSEGKE